VEQIPEIDLTPITAATLFLPIPTTDPLTTLLTKYIPDAELRPHRDLSGDWHRTDFHTLVMTNSWRALATMARDRIVYANNHDWNLILGLWHIRLTCLARLRLFNQTIAECSNLYVVLNDVEPESAREFVFNQILPFELEVLHARIRYWEGNSFGYLDSLSLILRKCKLKCKSADETTLPTWKERAARICLIIASQLLEMKSHAAASKLLTPLCTSSPELRSAVARIYLQAGQIEIAGKHVAIVEQDPLASETTKLLNRALLSVARGDWQDALARLEQLIAKDPENAMIANNLAVAYLTVGRVREATDILEHTLKTDPGAVTAAEPLLFNLSTLYELRSATVTDKKRDLLIEVAKWSGDGIRTTCLKLPSL